MDESITDVVMCLDTPWQGFWCSWVSLLEVTSGGDGSLLCSGNTPLGWKFLRRSSYLKTANAEDSPCCPLVVL